MGSNYKPSDHIQRIEVASRADSILEHRDISVQSYQTTIAFDFDKLDSRLDNAWLSPQIRFGVFSRDRASTRDALNVVLGIQDELSVRAYDYDARRPLWFSWKDIIVETVSIRYLRDAEGLICFRTAGGRRKITDERLGEFNSSFLGIPRNSVTKQYFDLEKLRDLCFDRFFDKLYQIRFSEPSGEEYRSIDHALFQSRGYIDPNVPRLEEVRSDQQVKIESFESDIVLRSATLAKPIQVRFFVGGLSGSLRLRFPKIQYKKEFVTVEEHAVAFYNIVDKAVSSILDSDYYSSQRLSLDELDVNLGLFSDAVDLAPFQDALGDSEARKRFLSEIDVGKSWQHWCPHLRALDELIVSKIISENVSSLLVDLASRDPQMALRLLSVCQDDPKKHRVGSLVAGALSEKIQTISSEMRAQAESALLSWVVECEEESWDVDPESGYITVLDLRWQLDDLSLDVIPCVLWKLVGVLHSRLSECDDDVGALLDKYAWCIAQAKALSPNHSKNPTALRLVASGRVPQSARDGAHVLKQPVDSLPALDQGVLAQYGLPLWPQLSASRQDGQVHVSNTGIGAAIGILVRPVGVLFRDNGHSVVTDILPDDSFVFDIEDNVTAVEVEFEKYGRRHQVTLEVAVEMPTKGTGKKTKIFPLPVAINRKRRAAQLQCRKTIDPEGIVVGSSSAMLEVFENIHYANSLDECQAVLILGEPGVGKTHIAQLLHESSPRASKAFKVVNAGIGGGDFNIQRGEWIGYGKGHGIQGVDSRGRPGHLMNVDGGTLFVDEFATMSQDLQVIFLSVLEGRSIEKIGGEPVTPNVRCVFATNADIDEAVAAGKLRRDLVDRIGIAFRIPPLRDRRGDILLLTKHFASKHDVTNRCSAALLRHEWPGNIRELQKRIGRAVARKKTEDAPAIDLAHIDLPIEIIKSLEPLNDDTCRRMLWHLADEIARAEGFTPGTGLQKRAGEIMGVGEAQASKMYNAHGLSGVATA